MVRTKFVVIAGITYIQTETYFMKSSQIRSGKTLIQQGDMVGAFKLDVKTVYDTPGNVKL